MAPIGSLGVQTLVWTSGHKVKEEPVKKFFIVSKIIILTLLLPVFLLSLMILVGDFSIKIIRRYTVINNTDKTIYITPLIKYSGFDAKYCEKGFSLEENCCRRDTIFGRCEIAKDSEIYLAAVKDTEFQVLPQYLFYKDILPGLVPLNQTNIQVPPKGKHIFYINYEDLKHEMGPKILLIRENNNYYFLSANFWKSDTIESLSGLNKASNKIIRSVPVDSDLGVFVRVCVFYYILFLIVFIIPYWLIRTLASGEQA
jgi:hypothetical protein